MTIRTAIIIAIAVFIIANVLFVISICMIAAGKEDNNEDDQEQMAYLAYYNKTRKGGTKDGNKTEKPEDSQS